jgi:hypothetical protein
MLCWMSHYIYHTLVVLIVIISSCVILHPLSFNNTFHKGYKQMTHYWCHYRVCYAECTIVSLLYRVWLCRVSWNSLPLNDTQYNVALNYTFFLLCWDSLNWVLWCSLSWNHSHKNVIKCCYAECRIFYCYAEGRYATWYDWYCLKLARIVQVLSHIARGRIFSHGRPFYEQAVSNLDRSMHRSLWV